MWKGDRIEIGFLRAGRIVMAYEATLENGWMELGMRVVHSHFTVVDVEQKDDGRSLPGCLYIPYAGTVIRVLPGDAED